MLHHVFDDVTVTAALTATVTAALTATVTATEIITVTAALDSDCDSRSDSI